MKMAARRSALALGCLLPLIGQNASETAVVHSLVLDAKHPQAVLSLPEGVAVIDAQQAGSELSERYREARSRGEIKYTHGARLAILAAGPLLDQPDQVAARMLQRRGHRFTLEVAHTSARLQGTVLFRNVVWRPLIQQALPQRLAAGRYQVEVVWRALDALPNGGLLEKKTFSTVFEITR